MELRYSADVLSGIRHHFVEPGPINQLYIDEKLCSGKCTDFNGLHA